MALDRSERRLSAIFAADLVGYSRLMEVDEAGTITRQRTLRNELIDPKIAAFKGRIVNTSGDGLLVEFGSAFDAVECAAEIQSAMGEREDDRSDDQPMQYRIGINLGDIVVEGDDIFGDAVNVAARLEALCEPGGICISDAVYQGIEGKLDLAFSSLGLQTVKNITKPVHVWQWRLSEPLPERVPGISGMVRESSKGDPKQSLKFFAVDDDELVVRIYRKLLEDAGYQVETETSSPRALSRIRAEQPDVVLLDIMMPNIDGLEMCKELRADKALDSTKIVIISAKSYEFDRKRALQFGANGFLVKPVEAETFLPQLERILDDKIELAFWGVRGTLPVPGPRTLKYGGNTSCVTLEFPNGQFFIFDAGTGIKALSDALMRQGRARFEATIFISHPHWDHINALPFFVPLFIPGNQFNICGPIHGDTSMRDLISAQMDDIYFPITIREFGAHVTFQDLRQETIEIENITVKTMLLSHPGYCLGYRCEYGGRTICYITDNEIFPEGTPEYNPHYETSLAAFCQDADYLITDTTYTDAEYEQKAGWGHSCISKVVELAHNARVKNLCLVHHDPDQDDDAIDAKQEVAARLLEQMGSDVNCLTPTEGVLFKV